MNESITFTRHTHTIHKSKIQSGATGSCQRANVPLMGYPVTKTIRTESNATHDIKKLYQESVIVENPIL